MEQGVYGGCLLCPLNPLLITSEMKQYYEALFLSYRLRTECSISQTVPSKIGFPTLTSDAFLNQKPNEQTSHE